MGREINTPTNKQKRNQQMEGEEMEERGIYSWKTKEIRTHKRKDKIRNDTMEQISEKRDADTQTNGKRRQIKEYRN